jgi:hypothetical protein
LTDSQRAEKLQKDSEYEIAVQNLSTAFYTKKRTVGVTAKEEADYQAEKNKLWSDYYQWAISAGLYEQVTPEQQLADAENTLNSQLEEVNRLRIELERRPLEIKETLVM